ncbi:MAG: tetratricopeptide repeat protein, partial [Candidatus Contendobacter sp.]|nr:tetratricopeptide repeat protein [Candidatus Contendobacter sp.]
LRAELEPAGRWEVGLRNDLAKAYLNRGIAHEQEGRLTEAVADWERAAAIYRTVVEQGWLPAGADLLKAMLWALVGYRDLADWPSAAQYLWAFIEFYQPLEALWAEQHGELEPPWRDIVGQFAGAVHGLNPDQRAALLEALGENAEAVKRAFGWE